MPPKAKPKPKEANDVDVFLNRTVEMVSTSDLTPHPDNPRRGDINTIAESIKVNGFYGALVAQRSTGRILVGNHRYLAAQKLGIKEVPVAWVDVDDARAKKIMLADNRSHDLGDYDSEALAKLISDLYDSDEGLLGTGYTDDIGQFLMGKDEDDSSLLTADQDEDGELEEAEKPLDKSNLPEVGSQIAQVQLFFTVSSIGNFLERVSTLKKRWEIENVTDVVDRAITEAIACQSE